MFISPADAQKMGVDELREVIRNESTKFGFDPQGKGGFFDSDSPEPSSDNMSALQQLIQKFVHINSNILTVPTHYSLYFQNRFKNVFVFDIAPAQIRSTGAMSMLPGHEKHKMYWCDVFTPQALLSLLEQTSPNLIDLSNIHEWAPYYRVEGKSTQKPDQEMLLQILTNQRQLHYIAFASPYPESGQNATIPFIELLQNHGWKVIEQKTQGSRGIVYLATR